MVSPIVDMTNTVKHNGISGIATQLLVLHSGECPLRGGYAQSLTNWANIPLDQGGPEASWHWFVDPIAIVAMVPPWYAAWHASEANPMSEGFEQSGYARYSRAEWTTPEGMKQLDNLAWLWARRAVANGIPARWLTTQEVEAVTKHGNRTIKGFCLHRQIDPETRTDPGDNYPFDLFTKQVMHYMGLGAAASTITEIPIEKETDEMLYLTAPGDNRIWLSNGVQKWHVPDPAHLIHIRTLAGYGALNVYADGKETLTAPALGVDMGAYPVASGAAVELKPADVAVIAASLKVSLAPELAADLARRLAE